MPLVRRIIRLSDEGEVLSARRSPRRGRARTSSTGWSASPRCSAARASSSSWSSPTKRSSASTGTGEAFRRHGWVVVGRRLVSVEQCLRIACPCDAAGLLPASLPELFDTAELAKAAAIERRLAQQMTYCLRAMGVLETAGKRGNAVVHRRVEPVRTFTACCGGKPICDC